jgi:phosphomethylpyrimidine synthase
MQLTRLESALNEVITPEMEQIAAQEGVAPEFLRRGVAEGTIVILHNNRRRGCPVAVGSGLRTKVSASIGLYGDSSRIADEQAKIEAAVSAGSDAIMDLSVSGDIDAMLRHSLSATDRPVGTLPLYQAVSEAAGKYGSSTKMETDQLFEVIERQAAAGGDFLALHCGTTRKGAERALRDRRTDPLVSFGGTHLIGWMLANDCENPLYEQYDRLLELARSYDLTISLADGMRPGCLADSLDAAQMQELVLLGELVRRSREAGVQVMVKGPGHVPINLLRETVTLEKSLCHGAPYFVFGPLVTDIAVGYDQINAAIGGAISAMAGAEFLCYVTAAEHVGLPSVQQVREGVIAARIAAHAADVANDRPGAREWDLQLSRARMKMDWEGQFALAVDPQKARRLKGELSGNSTIGCAMCGKYCAAEIVAKYLHTEKHIC